MVAIERNNMNHELLNRAIALLPWLNALDIAMSIDMCEPKPDLEKLATFDDFNFGHDIVGIVHHLDRTTMQLDKTFMPRCGFIVE